MKHSLLLLLGLCLSYSNTFAQTGTTEVVHLGSGMYLDNRDTFAFPTTNVNQTRQDTFTFCHRNSVYTTHLDSARVFSSQITITENTYDILVRMKQCGPSITPDTLVLQFAPTTAGNTMDSIVLYCRFLPPMPNPPVLYTHTIYLSTTANPGTSTTTLANNSLQLFPNPAKNTLNFQLPNNQAADLLLFNTSGQIIRQELNFQEQSLNIQDLPKGLYLLQFRQNGSIFSQKFIKE